MLQTVILQVQGESKIWERFRALSKSTRARRHCLSPPVALWVVVGAVLYVQARIGHLQDAFRGQSVRDDFGAGNASANMLDSLCGRRLSQAQVGLYFSSSELSTLQPSHLSGSCLTPRLLL